MEQYLICPCAENEKHNEMFVYRNYTTCRKFNVDVSVVFFMMKVKAN